MYRALIATVDRYAMAVSLLLGAKRFDIGEHGYVKIEPPGGAEACERSRKRIMSLVARLMDPCLTPRFEEVFRFEAAASMSEKKSLIHRRTPDVNSECTILNFNFCSSAKHRVEWYPSRTRHLRSTSPKCAGM
jgi:hypothetical protein